MKSRNRKLILSAVLTLSFGTTIFANERNTLSEKLILASTQTNNTPNYFDNYVEEVGEVIKVVNQNDFKRILAKDDKGNITSYDVFPYTPVLNYNNILFSPSVGDKIKAVYKKNTKDTKVNPPQVNALGIVVLDHVNSYDATYDTFDKNFLSHNKNKSLSITDSTVYLDINMEPINKKDVIETPVMVLHSVVSGNSPKSPKKILARKIIKLNDKPTEHITIVINNFMKDLGEEGIYCEGEIDYIKLNDITKKLGLTALWNPEDSSITMKTNKSNYVFKIGDKNFVYNNTNSQFLNAPILYNENTYISYDFALDIMYKHYLSN